MALQWRQPPNALKAAKTLGETLITLALNYASPLNCLTKFSIAAAVDATEETIKKPYGSIRRVNKISSKKPILGIS